MSKIKTFIKNTIITAILGGTIYGLNLLYMNPYVAETIFAKGITRFISGTLSLITNLVSISIAEIMMYAFYLSMFILLIIFIIRLFRRKIFKAFSLLHRVVNFLLFVVLIASVTITVMYRRESSFSHLGLTYVELDDDLAYEAANYYADLIIDLNNDIERDDKMNAVNPYTDEQLSNMLNDEFKKQTSNYFASYSVRVKGFYVSDIFSYLGILGMYFPFTSEANINTNTFPYQYPTTMAHEMAHAKGVLKENEANFVAYYITLKSSYKFLQYSGAMDSLMVLLGELEQDKRLEVYNRLPLEVRTEYTNSFEYYEKYEGFINDLSSKINDLYLKSSGQSDGIRSYSRTANEIASLYLHLKNI